MANSIYKPTQKTCLQNFSKISKAGQKLKTGIKKISSIRAKSSLEPITNIFHLMQSKEMEKYNKPSCFLQFIFMFFKLISNQKPLLFMNTLALSYYISCDYIQDLNGDQKQQSSRIETKLV